MKLIPLLAIIIFASCVKQNNQTCVCTNYAKANRVEATYQTGSDSECNYHQLQYDQVWPGEVICELK